MSEPATFTFVTCQVGAEGAVKADFERADCRARLAFSRPGFLTFKLPEPAAIDAVSSTFVRASGLSIGKAQGDDPLRLAQQVWELVSQRRFDRLHVWQRDRAAPGAHGFLPAIDDVARAAEAAIRATQPLAQVETGASGTTEGGGRAIGQGVTHRGQRVLDVIVVEPDLWWVGHHRAKEPATCWPGGLMPLALPPAAVSRAWLKMEEALAWSQLPLLPGQRVVEIGSAPGGASQSLLERGLLVTGIDPAVMHPEVLKHPNFTHVRKRGADVRRREFRKIRWLTADMNVAPNYTLDTVEAIVTHPDVNVRGLLLTLKLIDWDLAKEVPGYLDRIRSWGFADVRARQLQHNRQEICVAALRSRPRAGHAGGRRQSSSGRRSTPA